MLCLNIAKDPDWDQEFQGSDWSKTTFWKTHVTNVVKFTSKMYAD